MKTPVIGTERLILRPLELEDAEEVFENWKSDIEVSKYMLWTVHDSVEDTVKWLELEVERNESLYWFSWGIVLKKTGELIGSCGLYYYEEKLMYVIGYNLMKKYWNCGFATESAKAIIEFANQVLNVNFLFGEHHIDNPSSGRVLNKLGFEFKANGIRRNSSGSREFKTCEYVLEVEK